jgi:hypothetical protein
MQKKHLLILFLIISICVKYEVFAQTDTISVIKNKLNFYAAYSGNNLINPGINFGTTYPILIREKHKIKNEKQKNKIRQLNFDGNIGFYWDPLSHFGIYTNYGLSYLKTYTRGFQYKIGLNPLGYYRSFLPETYEVNENWEVEKVFLPGRSYYAPSMVLGIGKSRPDKILNAWFLNIKSMLLTPYNGHVMPLVFIEYGYRFKL